MCYGSSITCLVHAWPEVKARMEVYLEAKVPNSDAQLAELQGIDAADEAAIRDVVLLILLHFGFHLGFVFGSWLRQHIPALRGIPVPLWLYPSWHPKHRKLRRMAYDLAQPSVPFQNPHDL